MKRDGRSFDHRTLEAIRLMAVERVRDGEQAATVIASYGFSRTTIYKWLAAAAAPGVGVKALALKACDRTATNALTTPGAAGFSLDQRLRSAPIWIGFWPVDAISGGQSH